MNLIINNKITERFKIVLLIGFIILFQQLINAQANQQQQVLQKVGVLDSLYSKSLKAYRKLYIQLPDNYDENKKYPVAFILDGEVLLPTVHNVQRFYSGGFTPEMVLVGISNANNRTRDLTTSKIKEYYGRPFNQENGGAENFSAFLETELIPYLENKYPITQFRTLIGHSYGGLFTIYTLIHHPQLFSNYLAIDPSLDWDNQKLIKEAKEKLATQKYKGKSLFMTLNGQLHLQNPKVTIENVMQDTTNATLFSRSNIAFSTLVKQNKSNGLAFGWKFYPRDLHGTIPFPSIMDGLIFNFEWYQMENTYKINSFDTPKEELFSIIKHREKKLQENFGYSEPPYPEELLTISGYMNMDMEQLDKAKMYFELAIEFYPESANVYDAMADYYERNNDYKKALQFVVKAFEISGEAYHKQRIKELKEKK